MFPEQQQDIQEESYNIAEMLKNETSSTTKTALDDIVISLLQETLPELNTQLDKEQANLEHMAEMKEKEEKAAAWGASKGDFGGININIDLPRPSSHALFSEGEENNPVEPIITSYAEPVLNIGSDEEISIDVPSSNHTATFEVTNVNSQNPNKETITIEDTNITTTNTTLNDLNSITVPVTSTNKINNPNSTIRSAQYSEDDLLNDLLGEVGVGIINHSEPQQVSVEVNSTSHTSNEKGINNEELNSEVYDNDIEELEQKHRQVINKISDGTKTLFDTSKEKKNKLSEELRKHIESTRELTSQLKSIEDNIPEMYKTDIDIDTILQESNTSSDELPDRLNLQEINSVISESENITNPSIKIDIGEDTQSAWQNEKQQVEQVSQISQELSDLQFTTMNTEMQNDELQKEDIQVDFQLDTQDILESINMDISTGVQDIDVVDTTDIDEQLDEYTSLASIEFTATDINTPNDGESVTQDDISDILGITDDMILEEYDTDKSQNPNTTSATVDVSSTDVLQVIPVNDTELLLQKPTRNQLQGIQVNYSDDEIDLEDITNTALQTAVPETLHRANISNDIHTEQEDDSIKDMLSIVESSQASAKAQLELDSSANADSTSSMRVVQKVAPIIQSTEVGSGLIKIENEMNTIPVLNKSNINTDMVLRKLKRFGYDIK